MPQELKFVENPTVVVVPPPDRRGRYRLEFRRGPTGGCPHPALHALLWLIFVEAGEETGREIADVICAQCDPDRFARARSWAAALGELEPGRGARLG